VAPIFAKDQGIPSFGFGYNPTASAVSVRPDEINNTYWTGYYLSFWNTQSSWSPNSNLLDFRCVLPSKLAVADLASEPVVCGQLGNGCYANLRAMQKGRASLPDGTQIELVSAAGAFKVWKEKNGSRLLNAAGIWTNENNWQKRLTRNGLAFSDDYLIEPTLIRGLAGRVCPPNVFLSRDNMVAEGRCLYFDGGNQLQALSYYYGPDFQEATDWLRDSTSPTSGRGSSSSYFEGNIKTCADKGMRLPVIYETTINGAYAKQKGWMLPSGESNLNVVWAEQNGVPSFQGWTWTSTAIGTENNYYQYYRRWYWDETGIENASFKGYVRCVLP
jgi:hypothetical protein